MTPELRGDASEIPLTTTPQISPRLSRSKRRLFGVVLAALFWLFLEGVGFVAWRVAVPHATKVSFTARWGAEHAPPRRSPNTFWHHELNPGHPEYRGIVNSHGTKGPEFPLDKPTGELRVACLGDSTVEGIQQRVEDTFPARLEVALATRVDELAGHRSVRVLNCGIGSHNSAFNLAYLAHRVIHFDPDVVVIKSSYNDYLPYVVPGLGVDYSHVFPEPYVFVPQTSDWWQITRYSYVLRFAALALFDVHSRQGEKSFSGAITADQARAMDMSPNADRMSVYGENIRSMILLCRGRGIDVLVTDLPTSGDERLMFKPIETGTRYRHVIATLESELFRVAREEDVTIVHTGLNDDGDFWDHCHTTVRGNEKVAAAVTDAVVSELRR